jgi:hypothetical protein
LRRKLKAVRARWQAARLSLRNRWSAESLLDPSGPVVSLTTHPGRLDLAFHAIESIGNGYLKPSRIILWITDEESRRRLPITLRRLEKRGLSIEQSEELGPHTKYYPYVERSCTFDAPLVTADDDVIYPRDWLAKLSAAHQSNPEVIHCFRARRMRTTERRLVPYNSWLTCADTRPSHLNFVTGTLGAIYPPGFLRCLKQSGKAFQRCCPTADDIWLTTVALRGGFKIAQLGDRRGNMPTVPNSQKKRLFDLNVLRGENQVQLIRTLSEADLATLQYEQKMELQEQRHSPVRGLAARGVACGNP